MNWLKTDSFVRRIGELVLIAILVSMFVVGIAFLNKIFHEHDHENAIPTQYAIDNDISSSFEGVLEYCDPSYKSQDRNKCDQLRKVLAERLALSDLTAQQSMAVSTRGMFYVAYAGLYFAIASIGLLSFTVVLTYRTLKEASKTAAAAKATLEETKRANIETLRPYLTIEGEPIIEPEVVQGQPTMIRFNITIKMRNDGKTPAHNLTKPMCEAAELRISLANGDHQTMIRSNTIASDNIPFASILNPGNIIPVKFDCLLVTEKGTAVDFERVRSSDKLVSNSISISIGAFCVYQDLGSWRRIDIFVGANTSDGAVAVDNLSARITRCNDLKTS